MPRQPRLEVLGNLYHVLNRGNNKKEIFLNDHDYSYFLKCINSTMKKYPFILNAFVLMPNHFHMLIETTSYKLSEIIKSVLTKYSLFFNKKYDEVGHVFQGRYHSFIVQKEKYMLQLIRYIHQNPVRAGIVRKIEEWKWSSYFEFMKENSRVKINMEILQNFGKDYKSQIKEFKYFLMKEVDIIELPKFNFKFPILGDKNFQDRMNKNVKELRRKVTFEYRIPLKELFNRVGTFTGNNPIDIKSKDNKNTYSKRIFCYLAYMHSEYSLIQLSEFLGISSSAISQGINIVKQKNLVNDKIVKEIYLKT
ncbi:MAG: transposase [Spirochaetes bacterium]|nr:transposase [Spirochaetota bacterium]